MPRVNDSPIALPAAVDACRADAEALRSLRGIYARADGEAAERGLRCRACGACCRFASAGHRLLVSAAELALLTERRPAGEPAPGRCGYQLGARCTASERRPLGCRVYFCDEPPAAAAERYERYHAEVRRLHDERGLGYAYVELTAGIAELLAAGVAHPGGQKPDFPVDTRRGAI
mgnify:CR=1 FL=1